jgi:hypothetical protein
VGAMRHGAGRRTGDSECKLDEHLNDLGEIGVCSESGRAFGQYLFDHVEEF